jgi:hypothetical protein
MRPISKPVLDSILEDPFYKQCCIPDDGLCEGRVQFHHNLIFAGNQVDKKSCILPACQYHHRSISYKMIKEQFDWIMLNRMSDQELEFYSKAIDYKREKNRLNNLYGIWG